MEDYISNEAIDILEPVKFDNTFEQEEYVNYLPSQQGNLNSASTTINIEIHAGDKYHLISKSHILIEGQLVTANDAPFAENADIALVNNAIMYLFNEIRYELGGKVMERIQKPGHTSSMLGYLSYPDDYNTSSGLMCCWSKDSTSHSSSRKYNVSPAVAAGVAVGVGQMTPSENPDYNQGFAVRKTYLSSSNPRGHFTFVIPFDHMFGFADYKKVLYNVDHTLSLTRNVNDNLAIHRANGVADGKIKLNKLIWRVPQIKLAPTSLTTLRSYITKKGNIPISFSGRNSQSTDIPQNLTSFDWKLPTQGGIEKPRWIIIGFQTEKNTTQEQNPAIFDHLNLESVYAELNGQRYPTNDFRIDFVRNNYTQLYEMFDRFKREHFDCNALVGGSQVNLASFKSLFPIIVLDVRRQSEELKSGVVDMMLHFHFTNAVPANTTAFATVLSDRLFKLSSDGVNLTMITY